MQAQRDLSETQAGTVVAYLRLMALSSNSAGAPAVPVPALAPGDATRGKLVFESAKGNCLSCHRVGNNGSRFGPDLSAIGSPPRGGGAGRGGAPAAPDAGPNTQVLARKLLEPKASMSTANRYVRLVEKNGNVVAGKLLNADTFYSTRKKNWSRIRSPISRTTRSFPQCLRIGTN